MGRQHACRSGVGASHAALFTLNEPRSLSDKQKLMWAAGAIAYLFVTVLAYLRSTVNLTSSVVPHYPGMVLSAISGVISFLLYWQAHASRSRGFFCLAATFMYLSVILFAFPLLWRYREGRYPAGRRPKPDLPSSTYGTSQLSGLSGVGAPTAQRQ